MIPLYKLEKLPRIQQLRKIAKIFIFAENRLSLAAEKKIKIYTAAELAFFTDTAKLLSEDLKFSQEARKFFIESTDVFKTAVNARMADLPEYDIDPLRRVLNGMKHLLLAETGKDQADWDFTAVNGRLDAEKRRVVEGMVVYMEDIRSPFNVGAMFRTAESFGVEKIILSPFCADPRHKRAERTA
ncbi:MAG: TrmH family RNA methyltransferase, partial [Treponema sp.]|nr:TrmH family RNA methyltransferase [Treponema sp.]